MAFLLNSLRQTLREISIVWKGKPAQIRHTKSDIKKSLSHFLHIHQLLINPAMCK
jgi:hypothetical protein